MKKSESILASDVSEYLLRIKNNISIIYPPDEVNNIMKFLNAGIKEYITEHPEYTMAEIEEYLKTTDIFADWIQNTQSSEIADKIDFHSVQRKGGLFLL